MAAVVAADAVAAVVVATAAVVVEVAAATVAAVEVVAATAMAAVVAAMAVVAAATVVAETDTNKPFGLWYHDPYNIYSDSAQPDRIPIRTLSAFAFSFPHYEVLRAYAQRGSY